MGFSSLVTGYLGSQAQSEATEKAADIGYNTAVMQAEIAKQMFNQQRTDFLPFLTAGKEALDQLKTFDATGGAQGYLDKLNALTFPDGVDPTGGMQQYIDHLDSLNFQLDTNDPVYQWRASENERQVNQFFASRGGYDSRAAANMLLSSGMELQSQETERQFNQRYLAKYNQLVDLAKLSYEKGQAEYGAAKDKYSADVAKNTQGFNAAMTLGGTKYNQLLDLVKTGVGAAQSSGAANTSASNQLTSIWGNQGNSAQAGELNKGNISAALWSGVGESANNSLAAYLKYSGYGG